MTNWGRYWRRKQHIPKALCSSFLCIDSFSLFKNATAESFRINHPTHPVHAIRKDDHFVVTTDSQTYHIPIEKQPCQFGGFRYFFHCPVVQCNRRMRKLYYYNGMIICRRCLKLGYNSQRLTPCFRYLEMRDKIESKLIKAGGSLSVKPKWMKKITFAILKDRYVKYEFLQQEAFCKETFERFGHLLK